ncbi:hypothetical protein WAA24_004333 [Stenotrophomonas maltophilia]
MHKKAPATKKPSTDWAAELGNLGNVAEEVAFKQTSAAFDHELSMRGPGAPLAQVQAKIRAGAGSGVTNVLVRVPNDTLERIKTHVIGSHTSAVAVLADAMLDYLESSGQTLVSREKDK